MSGINPSARRFLGSGIKINSSSNLNYGIVKNGIKYIGLMNENKLKKILYQMMIENRMIAKQLNI